MTKKAGKMIISVDDREDGTVIEKLRALNVECFVHRLKIGDYVMGEMCIERKTIDDFCASIVDGRIKHQAENMKRNYKHNFVLISGRICDRKTEIDEHCVLGMISSLAYKSNINVICVDNEDQLVFLMKRLFERHKKDMDERNLHDYIEELKGEQEQIS